LESNRGLPILQCLCLFWIFMFTSASYTNYRPLFIYSILACSFYTMCYQSSYLSSAIQQTGTIAYHFPLIIAQRLHIIFNNINALSSYFCNITTWPMRLSFNHLSLYIIAPVLIILLLLSEPMTSNDCDLWIKPSGKFKPPKSPPLFGRKRCMFSSINSVNTNDNLTIPLIDSTSSRHQFMISHCQLTPDLPILPHRVAQLYKPCLRLGAFVMSQTLSLSTTPYLNKVLPFLHYLALPLYPMCIV